MPWWKRSRRAVRSVAIQVRRSTPATVAHPGETPTHPSATLPPCPRAATTDGVRRAGRYTRPVPLQPCSVQTGPRPPRSGPKGGQLAMRAYELMVILDGDLEDQDAQAWVKTISDQIKAAGGS